MDHYAKRFLKAYRANLSQVKKDTNLIDQQTATSQKGSFERFLALAKEQRKLERNA